MKTGLKIKKSISVCLAALILFAAAVPSFAARSSAEGSNRTVRVGFFAYPGYHEQEDGVRSGYGYDFLMLLQRYTNFRYEFVGYENSWEEMQQMLLDGEIDLVTSARMTAERKENFDFSTPIGENNAQINVRASDMRYTPGDYSALDGITLGEISGNSRNADVEAFAAEKGFSFSVKEYKTAEELETALREKRIDAAATSSLRKTYGEKTVAEFAPEDFYVIVKKGNTELLNEINYGIDQMDLNEGNWRDDLHYKNYKTAEEGTLNFTRRELDYIQAVQNGEKTITVTGQPMSDPYSFVENGEMTGIIPDYFAHLMELAGLPYTVLVAGSREQFQSWLSTNRADVVMDFRYGTSQVAMEDFGLVTDPYMQLTYSRVTRKGFYGTIHSVADVSSQGMDRSGEDIAEDATYIQVSTREDALRAVAEGDADACYVYTYMAEKYINTDPGSNLQSSVLKSPVYDEYIYISPDTDHELCSILNKCIKADVSGILDEYIKKYTAVTFDNLTFLQYLKLHPELIAIAALLLVALVVVIAVMIVKARTVKLKTAQLEKGMERLSQIKGLAGQFSVLYFVNLDTLETESNYLDEDTPDDAKEIDKQAENFFEAFKSSMVQYAHPDFREEMLKYADPVYVKQILKDKRRHEFRFLCMNAQGVYSWTDMILMKFSKNDDDEPVNIAVGYFDTDAEMRERLEAFRKNERDLEAIKGLAGEYDTLQFVDLENDRYSLYFMTDDSPEAARELDSGEKSFSEFFRESMEAFCHPDHLEQMLTFSDLDNIREALANENKYTRRFLCNSDAGYQWCEFALIRLDREARPGRIAVGYTNINDKVEAELEAERHLRENYDIIEILASEYTAVYYIDLVADGFTAYSMNDRAAAAFGEIFKAGSSYSESFRRYVEQRVAPEDRAMMLDAGSVRNVVKELRGKKTFITTYKDFWGRYSEMKFVKVGGEADKPVAVALGFADKDEELRALQEEETVRQRNIDIIEILASEYSSVYYIDLTTDELDPYTMNEETESEFGQIFRSGIKYSDAFHMYVDSLVYSADKEKMLRAGSIYNILKELADKKTFITTYRSDNNGDPHYCEMKFVKVGEAENPRAVALGFADKDDEIRDEMQRQAIAARDAAVIAGLSDDFGCVVYVEYLTGDEIHYRFDPLLAASIPGWDKISNFTDRLAMLERTVVHPDDAEFFRDLETGKKRILDILGREGVYYHNFRVVIDGEVKYYQLKIVRDENESGHIIAGFRNVDETVKREMEYQEKLEAANRSKTDFLFNMSHDIRTPMNAIIGFTTLAKKHIDDRERTMDSLNKIESSGNHLLELINEVLDMSRVEAGKLHSDMKTVNISEAAMKLVTICQESAAQRNVTLSYIEKNIEHPVVEADELHVNQIVMNILGNAIKYTPPGGEVFYTVEETEPETPGYGKYVLTVEDTGIGMSGEFLEHIYESFSREDKVSTSEVQGTGLGMAIVKRLVDYMDGTIAIESEQGKGTKVRVTLQLQFAGAEQSTFAPAETLQVNLSGRRVLLVEDNELNREIAMDILEEQGIAVEEAVNGIDAVEHVKSRGTDYYDFVLMDIQMPLMDGYQATREIRKLPGSESLPIIALSANAFEEDRAKAIEAGMNEHVSKPIIIPELINALARFVK